jgi:hypothetical protein
VSTVGAPSNSRTSWLLRRMRIAHGSTLRRQALPVVHPADTGSVMDATQALVGVRLTGRPRSQITHPLSRPITFRKQQPTSRRRAGPTPKTAPCGRGGTTTRARARRAELGEPGRGPREQVPRDYDAAAGKGRRTTRARGRALELGGSGRGCTVGAAVPAAQSPSWGESRCGLRNVASAGDKLTTT